MYPSFFEFFKYTFGIELEFLRLFQMFGFFMVLAFVTGGFVARNSFLRMKRLGIVEGIVTEEKIGEGASILGLLFNAIFGFAFGYKVVHGVLNSSVLFDNPQNFILSSDGNVIGGIVFAIIFGLLYYWESNKGKLPEPKMVQKTVFPHELLSEILVIAAITGIIGAKLFASIEDWDNFIQDPVASLMSFSGLTYYGGLIFGAIAVIIYSLRKNIPIKSLMDAAGPTLIAGYAVGRLGCHFSGDGDWGIPISGPNEYIAEAYSYAKPGWMSFLPDWMWSYSYPHNVAQEGVRMADCVGKYCFELSPPVFPTSIYEFILGMLIVAILIGVRGKLKYPGLLFALYLMLNGLERFWIEAIRVNPRYDYFGYNLSQAQYIAMGLFALGIVLFLLFRFTGKKFEAHQMGR